MLNIYKNGLLDVLKREGFDPEQFVAKEYGTLSGLKLTFSDTPFWFSAENKAMTHERFYLNWITFSLLALYICIVRVKPRFLIINTDPPFLSFLALIMHYLYNTKIIFNCRDLYPDVALEIGMLKVGIFSKLFDYINKKTLHISKAVVPLGYSMRDILLSKGIDPKKLRSYLTGLM